MYMHSMRSLAISLIQLAPIVHACAQQSPSSVAGIYVGLPDVAKHGVLRSYQTLEARCTHTLWSENVP